MPDRVKISLLLAPALLVIVVLFFGALANEVAQSLGNLPDNELHQLNLNAYRTVLTSPGIYQSFGLTLFIATISTLLASTLAVATALLLRRNFRGRAVVSFLVQLNLTIPHIVGGIGILYLLSQSGSFARAFYAIGILDRPANFPSLVFDPYAIGIIATYVWKEVPFITLILLAVMQTVELDYESVASTLGATRWQTFRHVVLPQMLPGLVPASSVVFAFTFGAYEIPALLGASHPQALAVIAFRRFTDADLATRPEAIALAMMIAFVSAIILALFARALRGKWRV